MIAKASALAFYDQGKHHVIHINASLKGLGAVLLQGQLAQYVHHGWPVQRAECDPRVRDYWSNRANIILEDVILFRGTQIIIPAELRLIQSSWTNSMNHI